MSEPDAPRGRAPHVVAAPSQRGVIVAVDVPQRRGSLAAELAEYEALVTATGSTVVGRVVQRLDAVDPATLIGRGKVDEVAELARERDASIVFVLDDLRPRQRANLEKILPLGIVDRTMVILDIFAQRARSREGKLQVELAQLRYRQANLIGVGGGLSRLGGGVGTRGPGETKLELDRRRIQARVSVLRRAIEDVRTARETRRGGARDEPLVALVGYTNVGKSSLLNRLTQGSAGDARGAFVANQPFATLDPTTRRAFLSEGRFVRVVDTVGFITELPRELVAAFRATLEELAGADLLLHVIDVSNPDHPRQRASVEKILAELELQAKPRVLVANKTDAADPTALDELDGAIPASAITGLGIDVLRREIERRTYPARTAR